MNRSTLLATALTAALTLSLAACGGPRGFGGGSPPDGEGGPGGPGGMSDDPELSNGAMIAKANALLFVEADTDRDHATSRAEFDAALAHFFAEADTDGSNILGGIEFSNWAEKALGSRYPVPGLFQLDTNQDQAISREEFTLGLSKVFDGYDKDENGIVTREELLTELRRQSGGPSGGGMGGGPGGGGGRPPGGGAPGGGSGGGSPW